MDTGRVLGDNGSFGTDGFRKPGTAAVSILFSVTILLFLMIGYRVQSNEFYSGVLVTEFLLIMLPALLFVLLFRYDPKRVLRLNKTGAVNFLVIFFIMLFALPLAGIFNLLNLLIVNSIFGKIIVQQPPAAENLAALLVNVLVIGGAAGICEEFLFRGVIQRGFERFGNARAILLAAFLFSLTHLDFQKIFGTFLLGSLIGFLVYRTDSLFSGMFAHFTNNSVAVVISYAALKWQSLLKGRNALVPEQTDLNDLFSMFGSLPKEQLVIVAFFYGFILLFMISIFAALIFAFIKLNPVRKREIRAAVPARDKTGLLWLLPGIAFIAVIYFAEVMRFRGLNGAFVEHLRRLLGI
jgi:membrane protease YdiL (CAAX protease family)